MPRISRSRPVLEDLAGLIYDSAMEPSRWPEVLRGISSALNATYSALQSNDTSSNSASIQAYEGWTSEHYEAYVGGYDKLDLTAADVMTRAVGYGYTERDYFDQDALRSGSAWNEFFVRFDAQHLLAATLCKAPDRVTLVSFRRGRRAGPFDRSEKRLFTLITSHLRRSLEVHRHLSRFELARATLEEALHQVQIAVLLVGGDGCISFMNDAAEAVLAGRDGIHASSLHLAIDRVADRDRLKRLLAEAMAGGGGAMPVSRPSGARAYQLLVAPLSGQDHATCAAARLAMVLITDPERRMHTPVDFLIELFDLTSAEARLAAALAEGSTLRSYAAGAGISLETARSHLKQAMVKTDSHHQAGLVRLVLASSAGTIR